MPRARTAELLAAIMKAFHEEQTWKQADLARAVGRSVEALRRVLEEMQAGGWPLERERDGAHVYWSVPKGWLPSGVVLAPPQVASLVRLLARHSKCADRDVLIRALRRTLRTPAEPEDSVWSVPVLGELELGWLARIEDAIAREHSLELTYFSLHHGTKERRTISFQRIAGGDVTRMCGYCHRDARLKWFRLDNVHEVHGTGAEGFVKCTGDDVTAFFGSTVFGFHAQAPVASAFRVRYPEARWVQTNLSPPMRAMPDGDGIRVEVGPSAVLSVARYVVGLGDAAMALTPELREAVERLAEGALAVARLDPDSSS